MLPPTTLWAETFFSDLTGKQIEALSKEYDYGYYSTPRRITTESISATFWISRSIYEEHLRKAENKVIESLMPYLKLFQSSAFKKEERIISVDAGHSESFDLVENRTLKNGGNKLASHN